MIKIIYGPKGTGKTKIIIDEANSKIETAVSPTNATVWPGAIFKLNPLITFF